MPKKNPKILHLVLNMTYMFPCIVIYLLSTCPKQNRVVFFNLLPLSCQLQIQIELLALVFLKNHGDIFVPLSFLMTLIILKHKRKLDETFKLQCITKSQELPRFPYVQVACDIPFKSY